MNLKIGNLVCRLAVEDEEWERLIEKKYQFFKAAGNKPDLIINLIAWDKESFHLSFSPDISLGKLYIPKRAKKFKTFDFFLKTGLATLFLSNGGFFLHGASLLKDGKVIIFAGKKGAGKSTILKLASNLTPLNDDFAIIQDSTKGYFAHSSPFYEKNDIPQTNIKAPIKAVFLLVKASENQLKKIPLNEAIIKLASLILLPNPQLFLSPSQSTLLMEKIWSAACKFPKKTPCFMLYFKKDNSFLELLKCIKH
ncbi:MAG: hypothetical protein Q7S03_03930 [bacterium]|nr:hypothetical protein [bacterium]